MSSSSSSQLADHSVNVKDGKAVTAQHLQPQNEEHSDQDCPDGILYSEDVLRIVFECVSLSELATCARVCKGWSNFLNIDDDVLWARKAQSIFWDTVCTTKRQLQKRISDNVHLAANLEAGNYVQDCHLRSWLLTGHNKQVADMILLGNNNDTDNGNDEGFLVTFGHDGQLRSWKLPFDTNRPPSTLLYQVNCHGSSFVSSPVDWLCYDDDEPSTSFCHVIIAERKRIHVVELLVATENTELAVPNHAIDNKNNTDYDNSSRSIADVDAAKQKQQQQQSQQLNCRFLQSWDDFDHFMTCTCLDDTYYAAGSRKRQRRWITGSSDSTIRVYNIQDEANKGYLFDTGQTPMVLQGHSGTVHGLVLVHGNEGYKYGGNDDDAHLSSPRTRLLYSRSSDQTVRIWNPTTGECLRVISFDGSIGGVALLGFTSHYMAVSYDSLELCSVRICRAVDGTMVRELTTESRISATYLYDHSLLCGTMDGSIIGFDLNDGSQTCSYGQVLGSAVTSVAWLVKDWWILAMGWDGEMCLVRASPLEEKEEDRVVQRIPLRFQNPGGMVYSDAHKTLLVVSSGYLVRALVFSP